MIQNKRLKGGLSKGKYMEILLTYLDDNQSSLFFFVGLKMKLPSVSVWGRVSDVSGKFTTL